MSGIESVEERQENEMQALKAIFGQDLQDLRETDVWKVWRPLECVVTLQPQQGSSGQQDAHVQIDLHVTCSQTYPDDVPKLHLEKSKGLSEQQIFQLKAELEALAKNKIGEVMIFELAQHVQQFLHQHNKPAFRSFYEEMLSRQKEQQQRQQQVMKLQKDKKRLAIQGEIERRKESLREEERQRKVHRNVPDASNEGHDSVLQVESVRSLRRRSHDVSESSNDSPCEHKGPLIIEFTTKSERQIRRGRCLGHSSRGCVVYSAMDTKTGQLFVLVEWTLKTQQQPQQHHQSRKKVTFTESAENSEMASYLKQVSSIEQELNYLQKLHHSNLVHYVSMKYVNEKECLLIYLLQEFVFGTNMTFCLSEKLPVDTDILRHAASGILEGLAFLHQNNIVHKDLRASCVFLTQTGLVRVSDYSLDKRLLDVYQSSVDAKSESAYPPSLGRGGKKADVYRLGILLLSMINGHIISEIMPDIPKSLPPVLKDFIHKCLLRDEHQRWSAGQLLRHEFLKMSVSSSLISDNTNEKEKELADKNAEDRSSATDLIFSCLSSGNSRIYQEFEMMKLLGKGSFGDVYKVRNKLDGGIYAIKRIELDPKNKELNRKITREVKLLSRLNHENVVRYFHSWIESATIEFPIPEDESTSPKSSHGSNKDRKQVSVNFIDGIEKLAPPGQDVGVEWSVSQNNTLPGSVSSDDSSDEEDWISFLPQSGSSDGIVFEDESPDAEGESANEPSDPKELNGCADESSPQSDAKEIQFMYIQMEFCEKSTLRSAIDNGLHADVERMERLFREIVEGLAHIHQQGMIHRDLKPVNIFLDSKDHVKIGDFGLATINVLPRLGTVQSKETISYTPSSKYSDPQSFSTDIGDLSLTGQVGTALYVAPELTSATGKTVYNQKVDIYSLGIIFFEMCSPPWETAMERVKVLANLRSQEIILPKDFVDEMMPQKVYIIRWLLNHDSSQRPTSLELLQSDYVPPPQVEEAALQEMVRHTLSEPQSKTYKYLVASCFKQEMESAADITYDMSNTSVPLVHTLVMQDVAKETAIRIFQKHGAVGLSTSLLMPKNSVYSNVESCVNLMSHSGGIVSLPHDLRVVFARYIAHNGITSLKRYAIDKVYREKKLFGFHPRELYECAFDIVTSQTGSLLPEAELLSVVWEFVCEFKSLRDKSFTIHLNHTLLLKAILTHLGVEDAKHAEIYPIINQARMEKYSRVQKKDTHLAPLLKLGLTEQTGEALYTLMEGEISLSKLSSSFRILTKRKGSDSAAMAKQALDELSKIASHAEALGVKCPMVITPGLLYNVHHYSGMMCQFVCELKKKRKKGGLDVIAAGGRYDGLVAKFRQRLEEAGILVKGLKQAAVGISISLDKVVLALQDEDTLSPADVVVCSVGNNPMLREKSSIVRDLWSAGIRTLLMDGVQVVDDVQHYCVGNNVRHIVMLKSSEAGTVKIRSCEKDRFQERKVSPSELVDMLVRLLRSAESSEPLPSVARADSRSTTSENPVVTPNVNISFILIDKLNASTRRRWENQIKAHIMPVLNQLSSKAQVEILVVNIEISVIKTLVSTLEFESEQEYHKSVSLVFEKHTHHKKYIKRLCDEIEDLRLKKNKIIIFLYSMNDSNFKVLM